MQRIRLFKQVIDPGTTFDRRAAARRSRRGTGCVPARGAGAQQHEQHRQGGKGHHEKARSGFLEHRVLLEQLNTFGEPGCPPTGREPTLDSHRQPTMLPGIGRRQSSSSSICGIKRRYLIYASFEQHLTCPQNAIPGHLNPAGLEGLMIWANFLVIRASTCYTILTTV